MTTQSAKERVYRAAMAMYRHGENKVCPQSAVKWIVLWDNYLKACAAAKKGKKK